MHICVFQLLVYLYLCIVFAYLYCWCICICVPVKVHVGLNLNNKCHKNQNLAPIQSVREYPSELDGRRLKSLCRKVHLETQLSEKFRKVLRVHLRSFSAQNIPFFIRKTLQNLSSRLCFTCFNVFHLQQQIIVWHLKAKSSGAVNSMLLMMRARPWR